MIMIVKYFCLFRSTPGANGNAVDSKESEYDNGGVTEYEVEPLPALGTARALYPFDGNFFYIYF